ncbi:hypothetical protein CKF94_06760 [Vibrio coralliilyticus]|uniref:YopT-type cysteine protease domain-containing protein n=1 Tax=Vibrio coralliilyticus TaxID=190893 RepID=UPI000BAAD8CB|nr:YopT-type cysteine protease domain-containing protein [Vibrio coralliilyticus]PAU39085.1 hypothetical protein CKF94_06760 [Vibrio coralliilyticus]
MSMTLYEANRFQPDICKSLTTEWLGEMMKGSNYGKLWCTHANGATENGEFYQRHHLDQAQLECTQQIQSMKNIQTLLSKTPFIQKHPAEAMSLLSARGAAIESLSTQKTQKVMLSRVRNMKVVRSTNQIDINGLKAEFSKLDNNKRFYLISVRANSGSHAIAVASSKAKGFFSPSGYLYYYDPNLKKVVRWRRRTDLKRFLDKSLLSDYRSINGIWQVAPV